MKRIIIFSALITAFIAQLIQPFSLKAVQESNDNHEAEDPTRSGEITENLSERLEQILEEKKDEIEGDLEDLSKKKKGFIGEVTRVTSDALTISTNKSPSLIIPIDETVSISKSNKTIKVQQIAVGDWLILLGYEEEDNFIPKKILVSSESLRPKTHLITIGTIQDLSKTKIDILPRNQEETISFTLTKNTLYTDNLGEKAEQKQFVADLQCLIVGYENKDEKNVTTIRALAPFSAANTSLNE